MPKIEGPISSRLRKLFGPKAPEWNPGRPADVQPSKKTRVPKSVQGEALGGRSKKPKSK